MQENESKVVKIGDNFQEILQRLMTFYDVAAAELGIDSKVSREEIDSWLTGDPPKDQRELQRVADALGVSILTLLTGSHRLGWT